MVNSAAGDPPEVGGRLVREAADPPEPRRVVVHSLGRVTVDRLSG